MQFFKGKLMPWGLQFGKKEFCNIPCFIMFFKTVLYTELKHKVIYGQ